MSDTLQGLLDRIEKDGVQKAEAEAKRILDEARSRAEALTHDAKQEAAERLARAETDSKAFEARARKAIEQAARDLLIEIGSQVTAHFGALMRADAEAALAPEALARVIEKVAGAYVEAEGQDDRVEVLIPEKDAETIAAHLRTRMRQAMEKGLTLTPTARMDAGFTVRLRDGAVEHDFSARAIAEALAERVRPELAKLFRDDTAAS